MKPTQLSVLSFFYEMWLWKEGVNVTEWGDIRA